METFNSLQLNNTSSITEEKKVVSFHNIEDIECQQSGKTNPLPFFMILGGVFCLLWVIWIGILLIALGLIWAINAPQSYLLVLITLEGEQEVIFQSYVKQEVKMKEEKLWRMVNRYQVHGGEQEAFLVCDG